VKTRRKTIGIEDKSDAVSQPAKG